MSASRSFIDVLVGKLTAYVDASSRPVPSIQTAAWAPSLDVGGCNPVAATRAYASLAGGTRPRHTTSSARPHQSSSRTASVPSRTPAEHTAIQLLRRLGASDIHAGSSDADLRSACRRLLREYHPDAHPQAQEADRVAMSTRLRAVIRARDILEPKPAAAPVAA